MNNGSVAVPSVQGPPDLLFLKEGNRLLITPDGMAPVPTKYLASLHSELIYEHKKLLYGADAYTATGERRRMDVTWRRLYEIDQHGRLITHIGFLNRLYHLLANMGARIGYIDINQRREQLGEPHPRPRRYEIDPANVTKFFQLRARQDQALAAAAVYERGVFYACTGFGKMVLGIMICLLYPHAKIHVVVKRAPLVTKWVEYLSSYIPDVGQVGAGRRRFGKRVTVFCLKSLGHSDGDADVFLGDEVHELSTNEGRLGLSQYQQARMFGLSATPTGRMDGTDICLEAYFGPVIFYLPYWEGVALGLVVPMQVEWDDVFLPQNPAAAFDDPMERRRHGIWFNDQRNDIIAARVVAAPADEQKLVLTDTIFHAIELYRRLRHHGDFTLVYDKMTENRFQDLVARDMIPKDVPPMTPQRKEALRRRLEAGVGNYIATPTWSVGIDPTHLIHLYMTTPSSSEIMAQQAPGRASRVNTAAGKQMGRVHDLRDQFDEGFRKSAKERERVYGSLRWTQGVWRGSDFVPLSG